MTSNQAIKESIQAEYQATKIAAKLLKQELKQTFKLTTFSVTSACNVIGVKTEGRISNPIILSGIEKICKKYEVAYPSGALQRHVVSNIPKLNINTFNFLFDKS